MPLHFYSSIRTSPRPAIGEYKISRMIAVGKGADGEDYWGPVHLFEQRWEYGLSGIGNLARTDYHGEPHETWPNHSSRRIRTAIAWSDSGFLLIITRNGVTWNEMQSLIFDGLGSATTDDDRRFPVSPGTIAGAVMMDGGSSTGYWYACSERDGYPLTRGTDSEVPVKTLVEVAYPIAEGAQQ